MTRPAAGRPGSRGARRSGTRRAKRKRGKQPGAPGSAMSWTEPDGDPRLVPKGTCECGADLDGAADLGVARSCQQKEVPEPKAVTVQHDLHETRCQCGKTHVAPRPPGVPDTRGIDRAAAACAGRLPAGLPAPAGGTSETSRRRGRGGGIRRDRPSLPREGRVHGRRGPSGSSRRCSSRRRSPGSTRPRCGPGRPGRRNTSTARSPSGTPCSTSRPGPGKP